MRKIGLKDFYNYKYISSLTLSPEGDKLAYIVSSVNEEDNDYNSNLFMMRRDAEGKNWQEVQLVTDGRAQERFSQMWDVSPLRYIGNATTPTLIIHSDEDYRCPIGEGYQLFTALKHKGVPAKMVVFHGENHELSRSGKPKHRVKRLEEITKWFRIYTAGNADNSSAY